MTTFKKAVLTLVLIMVLGSSRQHAKTKLDYLKKMAWFEMTGYHPHTGQTAIHQSDARFRVVIAGRRFGKTIAAAKEAEVLLMQPNKRIWIVAPTYTLSDKVFREVWHTMVSRKNIPPEKIVKKAYSSQERIIRFEWGSELVGKSADNPDSLEGEGNDLIIIDEAAMIKHRTYEESLRPTVSDRQGKILFITKPRGQNWMYDKYLLGKSDDPDWESFHFTSRDNPLMKEEEIDAAKRELTDEAFRQEYLAEFSVFSGKVFKEWDPATHVLAPSEMPRLDHYKEVFFGYDHGFVNPSAFEVVGFDGETFWVIDEFHKSGCSEFEIVNVAQQLKKKYPQMTRGYADPSSPGQINAFNRVGITTYKAKNDVPMGNQCIGSKIKVQDDGAPRLYVSSKCKQLITGLNTYSHQDNKENPIKQADHAPDALRYAIYSYSTTGVPTSTRGDGIFG